MSLLNDYEFLPDEQDNNGNTPLFYAVAYQSEDDQDGANKNKIITELILRGCDPSQYNKFGRNPFSISDEETMETIGKAMEDPQYSENLQKRREYWAGEREKEIKERYETKKLATKNLNDYNNSRSRKMTQQERKKREELLSIMTARGGTLRGATSKTTKIVLKSSNIRPWGGSTETDQFQREVRSKLREMNKNIRERINDMIAQVNDLRDMVIEPEDSQENEESNEINSNPDENASKISNEANNYDDTTTNNNNDHLNENDK